MNFDPLTVGFWVLIVLAFFALDSNPSASRRVPRPTQRHRSRSRRRTPSRQVVGASHPEQYAGLKHQRVAASGGNISNREDRNLPATVYLVRGHSHVKVGITSRRLGTQRIDDHRRHGWYLVESWETPSLVEAHRIEQALLRTWRTWPGTRSKLAARDMPQGGVTETAHLSRDQLNSARKFVADRVEALKSIPIYSKGLSPGAVDRPIDVAGTVQRLTPVRSDSSTGSRAYVHWWKLELTTPSGAVTLEVPEAKLPQPRPPLRSTLRARGVLECDNGRYLIGQPVITRVLSSSDTKRRRHVAPAAALGPDTVTGTIVKIEPGRNIVVATRTGVIKCTGTTRPTLLGIGVQVRVQGRFHGPENLRTVVNPSWQVTGHSRRSATQPRAAATNSAIATSLRAKPDPSQLTSLPTQRSRGNS